ncbi:hypothetical protein [Telmatospirillum sp.]|uniref:hypothetical protein n=1 Tax=Telmatospirillum sp. TaxID=2079197 RepID=UPI0028527F23|nr:hypothetical protein [Telmatospirillum sp.]
MSEQEYGPLRSRASRKPWPECPDIVIHRCRHCARLYQDLGYEKPADKLTCCGSPMERLEARNLENSPHEISINYKIVGGFNQNAVQVLWNTGDNNPHPDWIMLKTFTGSYIKYLTDKKIQPVVFPLSDEDAYVYCGRHICQQCIFRCKKGFVIYVYFNHGVLFEIPLENMDDYFKITK